MKKEFGVPFVGYESSAPVLRGVGHCDAVAVVVGDGSLLLLSGG